MLSIYKLIKSTNINQKRKNKSQLSNNQRFIYKKRLDYMYFHYFMHVFLFIINMMI